MHLLTLKILSDWGTGQLQREVEGGWHAALSFSQQTLLVENMMLVPTGKLQWACAYRYQAPLSMTIHEREHETLGSHAGRTQHPSMQEP